MTDIAAQPRLLLGSCPDLWGVWFAQDPQQTPWPGFLDEPTEVRCQRLDGARFTHRWTVQTEPAWSWQRMSIGGGHGCDAHADRW